MTPRADDPSDRSGRDRPGRYSALGDPGEPAQQRHNGHRTKLARSLLGSMIEPGDPDDPEEPIWKRHRPPLYLQPRIVLAFLVVLLFVGAVVIGNRHQSWPPDAQCDHPAIDAGVDHARHGYPVYWAMTGPNDRYAITFGAKKVRLVHGRVRITDSESRAGGDAVVLRQPRKLTGCRDVGHFDMPLRPGEYHLRMYRIAHGSATQVGKVRVDSNG